MGLTLIGIMTWCYSDGDSTRVALVSMAYIFAGSRMRFGALKLWTSGHLQKELPRYEYQKRCWQKAGKTNVALAQQIEAIIQGLANASYLALPAFIIAAIQARKFLYLRLSVLLCGWLHLRWKLLPIYKS
ncbi:hypothetical protein AB4140_15325 [Shewanella sp. 10N.286.51.B2]|uniref:hypothetical protein n=1 Tax=unclassified Shewanella TaxID=196818 RepID=UPI001F5360B5|nr:MULTISPECIES: hypothetical protein [unclassified Shewanella]MDO6618266.1 hypothetical protein [Shewanella sp. 6_MG-2023]